MRTTITPSNIPLITGSPTPAKAKKESMSDAFAGAAKAIVDVLKSPSRAPHVSPMKSAQLRRSCLEDLKELFEDGVLSQEEFMEQHTDNFKISLITLHVYTMCNQHVLSIAHNCVLLCY